MLTIILQREQCGGNYSSYQPLHIESRVERNDGVKSSSKSFPFSRVAPQYDKNIVKRNDSIGSMFVGLSVQQESRLSVGAQKYEFSYLVRAQLFWSNCMVYRQYKWWARQAYIGRYCARKEDWIPWDGIESFRGKENWTVLCPDVMRRELLVMSGIQCTIYLKEPNSSLREYSAVSAVLFIASTGPSEIRESPH